MDKATIEHVIHVLERRRKTNECELERARGTKKVGGHLASNRSAVAVLKFASKIEEIDACIKILRSIEPVEKPQKVTN
jgi:hypothetical protein